MATSTVYYYYDEFDKRVRTYHKKMNEKYFETEKKALAYFKKVEKEAEKLYKQHKKEYKEFMKNKPYFITYVMRGDTHGIYEDYLSLSFELKGFTFNFNLED